MLPGMMPILHSPGVSTPGQFGPIRRDFEPDSARFTLTMSSTGMPSVMHTINSISASIASRIESAANGGGTYMQLAVAPVAALASSTVLKFGRPRSEERRVGKECVSPCRSRWSPVNSKKTREQHTQHHMSYGKYRFEYNTSADQHI